MHRSANRTLRVLLAALLSAVMVLPAGCLMQKPDIDRLNMGAYQHHGGAAKDAFLIGDPYSEGSPMGLTVSPNSVRVVAWDLGGFLPVGSGGTAAAAAMAMSVQVSEVFLPVEEGEEAEEVWFPSEQMMMPFRAQPVLEPVVPMLAYVISDSELYLVDLGIDGPEGAAEPVVELGGFTDGSDLTGDGANILVADGAGGLRVVDVSDPSDPYVSGSAAMPNGAPATSVAAKDGHAYVTAGNKVYAFDVADGTPSLLYSADVTGALRVATASFAGVGPAGTIERPQLVYVASGSAFKILEDDGAALTASAECTLPAGVRDVAVEPWGEAAIVAAGDEAYALSLWDIDPSIYATFTAGDAFTGVSMAEMPSGMPAVLLADGAEGTDLMVPDFISGADVKMSSLPGWLDSYHYNAASSQDVAVSDYQVCVADGPNGLVVYNLFEGLAFMPMCRFEGTDVTAVDGPGTGSIAVADGDHVRFFTTAEGMDPVESKSVTVSAAVKDVKYDGMLAYAACGTGGVTVIDPAAPEGLEVLGVFDEGGEYVSVAAQGGTAFVGENTQDKLLVIDCGPVLPVRVRESFVADSVAMPSVIGSVAVGSAPIDLEVNGGLVWAACGPEGVRAFSADADLISVADYLCASGDANGISVGPLWNFMPNAQVAGDVAVVACENGVEYLDASDPGALTESAHYSPVPAIDALVYEGLPFVAADTEGVYMMSEVIEATVTAEIGNVSDGAAYESTAYPTANVDTDYDTGMPFYWETSGVFLNGSQIGGAGFYTFTFDQPGVYAMQAIAHDVAGNQAEDAATFRIIEKARTAGLDRYGTASALSEDAYPSGSGTVVIATGQNYADALAGAPLAYANDAPILLVGASIPASVTAEIERLGAVNAIILGGTGVVPASIETSLAALGITSIDRIGGANRYATAALIADELRAIAGDPETVFVATGKDFPDALSIGGIAAFMNCPILLSTPTGMPTETSAKLANLAPSRVVIVGGTGAVKDFAFAGTKVRLGGATRWDTARRVQDWSLANGFEPTHVFAASGLNYPDALSLGVPSALNMGPILLVQNPLQAQGEDFLVDNKDGIVYLHIAGGSGAVSDATQLEMLTALGLATPPGPVVTSAKAAGALDPRAAKMRSAFLDRFPKMDKGLVPYWMR